MLTNLKIKQIDCIKFLKQRLILWPNSAMTIITKYTDPLQAISMGQGIQDGD